MRTVLIVVGSKLVIPLFLMTIVGATWLICGPRVARNIQLYLRQPVNSWRLLGHAIGWSIVGIVGILVMLVVAAQISLYFWPSS